MNDVEKKLIKYRAQKEREAKFYKFKNKLNSYFSISSNKNNNENEESSECLLESETVNDNYIDTSKDNLSDIDSVNSDDDQITLNCWSYVDWMFYSLCFVLWVTLYIIFIQLQFGTVYFILSILIGIYLNTRTGPKAKNEISAYSVFNKNCESIDGTLKAEQFEREIMYGPSLMR